MQKQNNRVSKIVDIGELNNRIALMKEKYVGENPDTRTSVYKNIKLGDVQAKVSSPHGQECHTAITTRLEKQLSFITCYRLDVNEDTNIWFEGRGYDIGFIDNAKYGHEFMELKAEYKRRITLEDQCYYN